VATNANKETPSISYLLCKEMVINFKERVHQHAPNMLELNLLPRMLLLMVLRAENVRTEQQQWPTALYIHKVIL